MPQLMPDSPHVVNILVDPEKDITYRIMAYRELSREEKVLALRAFKAGTPKSKWPKPGTTGTILTTIGARERE